MGGSRLQLYSVGVENNHLTKNPEISYFKKVYKKYSNFALQSIDQYFEKIDSLDFNNVTHLKLKFGKNGNLIHKIFLEINIPAIVNKKDNIQYEWAANLAEIIVKNARIIIGGETIENYDDKYMYIYNNLSENNEEKKMRKEMTHIVNRNKFSGGNKLYTKETDTKKYINAGHNSIPSILDKKIIIPLPFWFHRDVGCSLPIQNLLYHDVMLELELRPIKELLNYYDTNHATTTIPNLRNYSYLKSAGDLDFNNTTINNIFLDKSWNINPVLNTTYIFLDDEEANYFNNQSMKYLIEPVKLYEEKGVHGEISLKEGISSELPQHMCKEFIVAAQRTDIDYANNWLNFSNLDNSEMDIFYMQNYLLQLAKEGFYEDVNDPESLNINIVENLSRFISDTNIALKSNEWKLLDENVVLKQNNTITNSNIQTLLDVWKYRQYNNIPIITDTDQSFYSNEIIRDISLSFDETTRINKRNTNYYNLLQPFIHHNNYIKNINTYSFSLSPDSYQPGGKVNFKHLGGITLNINTKEPSKYNENYMYNIIIYFRYYNILEIKSGMADLLFRN
tara:strand:+ start:1064 stop:2752 length:1689 start_codon:yes stop_codon:yes gene_type:complete